MSEQAHRLGLADDVIRRLASAVRSMQLYSAGHPLVARNVEALADTLRQLNASGSTVVVGFVENEIIVGDVAVPNAGPSLVNLARRLAARGIERVAIDKPVTNEEILALVVHLSDARAGLEGGDHECPEWTNIHIGRIAIERRIEMTVGDAAAIRRLYADAAAAVETLWQNVGREGAIEIREGQAIVNGLAGAVTENPAALLALTAMRNRDNYTFTHMVNVSILTMAQARSLGVDGPLLCEFGLGALLHDIGKVRVPMQVLQKPERLTDEELTLLRRHPIEGARLLRRAADIPPLVPLVAFEHHLRRDGTGYPAVERPSLNLATVLTSIADIYDAMRSQRAYQQVFASERVVEVLRENDGRQFDQDLVRRFVQLVGIYPVGTAVRLDTGHVAVVVRTNTSDAHRPRVRLVREPDGSRVDRAVEVDLWTNTPGGREPSSIAAPVDTDSLGIDPIACL